MPAVDAEPFGNREDNLPVRHGGADRVGDGMGHQQGAFLVTTRAQTSLAAGEGDEHFVATTRAADAGEAEVEVAATKELAGHFPNDGSP